MKRFIFLSLGVFLIGASSAFAFDSDVGTITKSELADHLVFDLAVATLVEVYEPVFNAPASPTNLPISKGTDVKPSKAVNIFRRARDAI